MPGYGASDKYDGQDVSLGTQGMVFTELLQHWGLATPQVVAHDFGGAVALRALLREFEGTPADLVAARSRLTTEHLAAYVGA